MCIRVSLSTYRSYGVSKVIKKIGNWFQSNFLFNEKRLAIKTVQNKQQKKKTEIEPKTACNDLKLSLGIKRLSDDKRKKKPRRTALCRLE